jgi:hypothetical protein
MDSGERALVFLRIFLLALIGIGLQTLAGCGKGGYRPLSGTVMVDGKPAMSGARVLFVPLGNTRPADAVIDADGRFTVTSVGKSGAMPGDYRVCLVNSVESIPKPGGSAEATEEQQAAGIAPKGWFEYSAAVEKFLAKPPTGNGWIPKFYDSPATTPLRWNTATDGFEVTIEVSSNDTPGS